MAKKKKPIKKKDAGAGKGDSPRPYSISQEELDLRWELGFGKISKKRRAELLLLIEKIEKKRKK
jgi:hypothetical protein